jgi:uncharacterized membrane protein YdbT with pleckstrin-like domain
MQGERSVLKVKYDALVSHELALGQMRFQAMAIFLTATVLIVEYVGGQVRGKASLLLALSLGMLILDLRSRALAWKARAERQAIEQQPDSGGSSATAETDEKWGKNFRFISHTTVFDLSYGGVLGYAISLFLPTCWKTVHHSTWPIEVVFAFVFGIALVGTAHLCAGYVKEHCA